MIPEDVVNKALEKINKTTAAYNYFFSKIENPAWLQPLKEKGFFTDPIPAIREGDFIRFPAWPESGYLTRVADKAQDEVLDVIKALPETDNERVMDDVVNALLKIDPAKVFRQTERVKKYVNSSQFLMLHITASDFICKLADAGYDRPALGLAKEMLDVLPDTDQESKLKEKYVKIEPVTKYRDYDYKSIVEKITPSLAKAAPLTTIDLFSDLLHKSIAYEFTIFKDDDEEVALHEKEDDFSFISRPNIEGENEYGNDPEDTLTTAVRDSVVALMQNEHIDDVEKLSKLKELAVKKYSIFKRIVEFALRNYKDNDIYKPFYDALVADEKLKGILETEKNGTGGIRSGIVTEKPTAVLKDLDDAELIEMLKTYKDESGWSFERDSISKELGELIRLNPKRFVPILKDIAASKNEYFDESIKGFEEAVDKLDEGEIISILTDLLDIFVAGNAVEESEKRDYYSWTKSSAVRLLEKVLSKNDTDSERITAKALDAVTKLWLTLCRDEDPTVKADNNFSAVDLSINSNRGKALHVVAYILVWMNRNKIEKAAYKPVFDELDWHLNPENDPVSAMRTMYGWRYELLHGTDKEWAKKNIDAIFTDDEFGEAAFYGYILFNRVHEEALKILGDVFIRQLPRLANPPDEDGKSKHDGLNNFVQHLALHYWHSDLDLADGSMIKILLTTADKKYIKELTNFIGFRLYKRKESEMPSNELQKLVLLWETIVQVTVDDPTKIEALQEFGGWFASGKFDPIWSLEQLTYAAEKAHNINLDFAALEHLETMAQEYPVETLKAISVMVDNSRERWAVTSWSKNVIAIIKTTYNSTNQDVKQSASDLANKLVAQGYTEYRAVISN